MKFYTCFCILVLQALSIRGFLPVKGDMGAVKMHKIIGLTVKLEFNIHLKGTKSQVSSIL